MDFSSKNLFLELFMVMYVHESSVGVAAVMQPNCFLIVRKVAHAPQSDWIILINYLFLARSYTAWEPYRDHIPEEERHDFVAAYSKRLNSTDESVQVSLVHPCQKYKSPGTLSHVKWWNPFPSSLATAYLF